MSLSAASEKDSLERLNQRVAALEKLLGQQLPCRAERLVIEKLITERVEIKLDSLDIKELSGILNIGQSYHSKIIRQTPSQVPCGQSPTRRSPSSGQRSPQIRVEFKK